MNFNRLIGQRQICFQGAGEGGGGGAGDGGDEGAAAAAAEAAAAEAAAAEAAKGGEAKWWENETLAAHKEMLTAKGLTVDDPMEAMPKILDFYTNAEKKLGKSADLLMDRPTEGQDVGEWLRENGETFGIPEAPDKYDVAKPESWPKDAPWDDALEGEARKIAHEEGITGKGLNRMVELFAGKVKSLDGDSASELATAKTEMQTALQADWGDQYAAKVTLAKQAASVLAQHAELPPEAMVEIGNVLKPKVGDAGTIKLFAAVGEMLGEDMGVALVQGGGLGSTPAEARQKLQELRAPGGDYYEATAKGDTATVKRLQPEIDRLTKLAG